MASRPACYSRTIITELKSSHDRIYIRTGQIRCDQVNVFFRSSADVLVSAIGTISDQYSLLFLMTDVIEVFFQELAVALIVAIELVVCYDRSVFANRFFDVSGVSSMFLSGLFPVSGIRIRWILEDFRIHPSIFLRTKPALSILNDRLLNPGKDDYASE